MYRCERFSGTYGKIAFYMEVHDGKRFLDLTSIQNILFKEGRVHVITTKAIITGVCIDGKYVGIEQIGKVKKVIIDEMKSRGEGGEVRVRFLDDDEIDALLGPDVD